MEPSLRQTVTMSAETTPNNTAVSQDDMAPAERPASRLRVTFITDQPTYILEQEHFVESPGSASSGSLDRELSPVLPSSEDSSVTLSSPPLLQRQAALELFPDPSALPSFPHQSRGYQSTLPSLLSGAQTSLQPVQEDEAPSSPPQRDAQSSPTQSPARQTSPPPHSNTPKVTSTTHVSISDKTSTSLSRLPILIFLLAIWLAHLVVSAASCAFQVCIGLTLGHVVLHIAQPLHPEYAADAGPTIAAGAVGGAIIAVPMSLAVFVLGSIAHARQRAPCPRDEEVRTTSEKEGILELDMEAGDDVDADVGEGSLGLWRALLVLVVYALVGAVAGPLGAAVLLHWMGGAGRMLHGRYAVAAGALGMLLMGVSVVCGLRVEGKKIGQDIRWGLRWGTSRRRR